MQNKYIDHLTVDEYKFLQSQLLKRAKEERRERYYAKNSKYYDDEYANMLLYDDKT